VHRGWRFENIRQSWRDMRNWSFLLLSTVGVVWYEYSDWAKDWINGVRVSAGRGVYIFCSTPRRLGLCTTHSYPVGSRTLSLASIHRNVKMTAQCSANIKNAWSYSSTLPYVFVLTWRFRNSMTFITAVVVILVSGHKLHNAWAHMWKIVEPL